MSDPNPGEGRGPIEDGYALPAVHNDGPAGKEEFLDALAGAFFNNPPTRGDKNTFKWDKDAHLLLYNTGHGGSVDDDARLFPNGTTHRYVVSLANGFGTGDMSDSADTDGTKMDGLQIYTRGAIPAGAELMVNGWPLGPLSSRLVSDQSHLDGLLSGVMHTYQIPVEHSLLTSDPEQATIELRGVSNADLNLVAAFRFQGGDQEYLAVVGRVGDSGGSDDEVGDANRDAQVDSGDVSLVLAGLRTCSDNPEFNPATDINQDGCVDTIDLDLMLMYVPLITDINFDGHVDARDVSLVEAGLETCTDSLGFNAAADITGDGCVDSIDLDLVQARVSTAIRSDSDDQSDNIDLVTEKSD